MTCVVGTGSEYVVESAFDFWFVLVLLLLPCILKSHRGHLISWVVTGLNPDDTHLAVIQERRIIEVSKMVDIGKHINEGIP